MSISTAEFPLSPLKRRQGIVPEPIVPVGIETPYGTRLFDFLVDSGADLSLLPLHLASQIGINVNHCPKSTTMGVEGRSLSIYHAVIHIRIGQWRDKIRCAIAKHDRVPPLLGRMDVFSNYTITFHAQRQSLIFQRPSKKVANNK